MTESEWRACDDPERLLEFLGKRFVPMQDLWYRPWSRKERLFACECARQVSNFLTDPQCLEALDIAERHADDLLGDDWEDLVVAFENSQEASEADTRAGLAAAIVSLACSEGDFIGRDAYLFLLDLTARRHKAKRRTWAEKLVRCVAGPLPFRQVAVERLWLTPAVRQVAETIYQERNFADLPVLADALEDAGCRDAEVLTHLRSSGPHVRGCWPVDLLLAK